MTLASVGWPDVTIALIAGLPGIIAALAALRVHQAVKTPSGTSIGKQTENLQHTALANHYRLRALSKQLGAYEPESAKLEETQIDGVTDRREHDA